MSEASFASLGPTLLARKGGAKPAMRPQLAPLPEMVADEQLEDLGWNDMGAEEDGDAVSEMPEHAGQETANIVPISKSAKHVAANEDGEPGADNVLIKTKPAAQKTAGKKRTAQKAAAPKSPQKAQAKAARRAAFTLRLDTDRHLKLRLAATMHGISAQALVTNALDTAFAEIEDLDLLASRMKRT